MKAKIILLLSCLTAISTLEAQDPYVSIEMVNSNVHEQAGHYLIITLDEPTYLYGQNGESIISGSFNPLLLIEPDTTGTSKISPISGLHIYPNPVHNQLFLQRDEWKDEFIIEFFTLDGIPLLKRSWPPGVQSFQIGAETLPKGIFVVSISSVDFMQRSQFKILRM